MRRNMQAVVAALIFLALSAGSVLAKGNSDDPFGDGNPFEGKPSVVKKCSRPKPTSEPSAEEIAKARIEQALNQKTTLEFQDYPLGEVVALLSKKHNIPIQLHRSVEDANIGTDTPVSCVVKDITLRSALKILLDKLDLTYTIDNEVLFLCTAEKADENLVAKIYDVADLVTFRDEKGEIWSDYESLQNAITTTVQPDIWMEYGGCSAIEGNDFGTAKILIIKTTDAHHREIAKLLEMIRTVAAQSPDDGQVPFKRRPKPSVPRPMAMGTPMPNEVTPSTANPSNQPPSSTPQPQGGPAGGGMGML